MPNKHHACLIVSASRFRSPTRFFRRCFGVQWSNNIWIDAPRKRSYTRFTSMCLLCQHACMVIPSSSKYQYSPFKSHGLKMCWKFKNYPEFQFSAVSSFRCVHDVRTNSCQNKFVSEPIRAKNRKVALNRFGRSIKQALMIPFYALMLLQLVKLYHSRVYGLLFTFAVVTPV